MIKIRHTSRTSAECSFASLDFSLGSRAIASALKTDVRQHVNIVSDRIEIVDESPYDFIGRQKYHGAERAHVTTFWDMNWCTNDTTIVHINHTTNQNGVPLCILRE